MSASDFLDYLKYERNYSEKTIINYGCDLREFEEFAKKEGGEELDLRGVSTELVREWVVALMEKGVATASVNRKLSTLRSFYKYLLKKEYVSVNPVHKITGPKKKKPLPAFLKESEIDQLLDEMDFGEGYSALLDRLIIQMFYETGMRLSELIELKESDVNLESQMIKVVGKRNKQRLIPFGEGLRDAISAYIEKRNKLVSEHSEMLFVRKNGKNLSAGIVYLLVKKHLSKVTTLKKRSPHVLRHTFATSMLNHQAELGSIKELLGHESLATTEIYTHTTFEELKQVYNQAHPRAEETRR